jgi:hypothetical protein
MPIICTLADGWEFAVLKVLEQMNDPAEFNTDDFKLHRQAFHLGALVALVCLRQGSDISTLGEEAFRGTKKPDFSHG